MSGLKPGWVKFRVFLVSAVCAGLGGIMFTLRLEAGIHTLGSGWEVDALAAVILGGANIRTGEGSVSATFLGLLLICFIKNLLTGTDWLYQWQSPVTIVLIVILLLAENRRAEGRLLRY